MADNLAADEDVVKYRLVGALVWLLLLLMFVPGWYANPVLQNENDILRYEQAQPIAVTPYRLPESVQTEEVKKEVQDGARERYLQDQASQKALLQQVEEKPLPRVVEINPQPEIAKAAPEKPVSSETVAAKPVKEITKTPAEKPASSQKVTVSPVKYKVKLLSYFDLEKATDFIEVARKAGYIIVFKRFDVVRDGKTKIVYQAYTEEYDSLDKAIRAKRKLDKIFVLRGSKIIKIEPKKAQK